jgi:hypothetical protein
LPICGKGSDDTVLQITKKVTLNLIQMRSSLGIGLAAFTTIAFAQVRDSVKGRRNGTGNVTAIVDTNKNGFCDNNQKKSAKSFS